MPLHPHTLQYIALQKNDLQITATLFLTLMIRPYGARAMLSHRMPDDVSPQFFLLEKNIISKIKLQRQCYLRFSVHTNSDGMP